MIRHCTVLVPCFISTETEKQNIIHHSASSPCKSMLVPSVHVDRSECNCKAFGRLLFVIALRPLAVDPLLVSCAAACSYATTVPYVPSARAVPSAVTCERQTILLLPSPPHPVPAPLIHAEESPPSGLAFFKTSSSLALSLVPHRPACVRGRSYSTQPFSGLSQPRNHHTVTVWKRRKWLY